jgi:hypothetical protein
VTDWIARGLVTAIGSGYVLWAVTVLVAGRRDEQVKFSFHLASNLLMRILFGAFLAASVITGDLNLAWAAAAVLVLSLVAEGIDRLVSPAAESE